MVVEERCEAVSTCTATSALWNLCFKLEKHCNDCQEYPTLDPSLYKGHGTDSSKYTFHCQSTQMRSIELYTRKWGYHYKCKHLSKPKGLNNSDSLLFKEQQGFTLLTAFSPFFPLAQAALAVSANWFVQWASDLNCKTTGTAATPPRPVQHHYFTTSPGS